MSDSIVIDRADFLQEDKKSFASAKRGFFEFLCVAIPKVAGGISILVLNVVLMRHFGPEQFGIYAICTTDVPETLLEVAEVGRQVIRLAFPYHPAIATTATATLFPPTTSCLTEARIGRAQHSGRDRVGFPIPCPRLSQRGRELLEKVV